MDDSMFPWINTPDEVADKVNQLVEEWRVEGAALPNETEQRMAGQRLLKRIVRETFMSHFAATEEDFERNWPRLRDDILCGHAGISFNEIFGLDEDDEWDEDDDGEDEFGDEFDDEIKDDSGH